MRPKVPKRTQKEKRMYPILKRYLKNNGWDLIFTADDKGPFKIWVDNAWREVDVAAFRWRNNNRTESIAIECKDGEDWEAIAYALPQAINYQVAFPSVYIATNSHDLGHMDAILDKLNLGYLGIRKNKVKMYKEASKGVVFQEKEFERQVKNWAVLLLAFQETMGKTYFGHDYDEEDGQVEIFVSDNRDGDLQYVAWGYETDCYFCIFAESKPTVRRIVENVDVQELFRRLNGLPEGFELAIQQKKHPEIIYKKKIGIGVDKAIKEWTLKELKYYLDRLRKWTKIQIGKTTMGGQIHICRKVWDNWVGLSRKQTVDKIRSAQGELSNLYGYLNELLERESCAK